MKKTLSFIFIFTMLFVFSTTLSAASSVSWYCKRNSKNLQPELGSDLKFVENFDVIWCDKKHSSMDDENKVIYLTFDAGYENGNIEKILDVLNEENVPATFFVLENLILKNKELVKRMIDEGHTIGNHTAKHKNMTKVSTCEDFKNELEALEKIYYDTFNEKMIKLYRPPEGKFNEENLKWARKLGYKTVMWSFAYEDWDNAKQPSRELAIKKITDNLHNGEIMLLHPTSSTNASIMKEMIQNLKKRGFSFGKIQDL